MRYEGNFHLDDTVAESVEKALEEAGIDLEKLPTDSDDQPPGDVEVA